MTDHQRRVRTLGIGLVLLLSNCLVVAQDKKGLEAQYKKKFVVVLKEGLAVGVCSQTQPNPQNSTTLPLLLVNVVNGTPTYKPGFGACVSVTPEPIHKGEILQVEWLGVGKVLFQGNVCRLRVVNVSPHAIERGVGAFAHESNERGEAIIAFSLGTAPDEVGQASSLLNEWFKVFDTQDAAAVFGNTASGVFVKEIKAGMTISEVEAVLGTPQTRVDLTDKVLYKYKDMTVEFHDGKVTDVR